MNFFVYLNAIFRYKKKKIVWNIEIDPFYINRLRAAPKFLTIRNFSIILKQFYLYLIYYTTNWKDAQSFLKISKLKLGRRSFKDSFIAPHI